MNSTAIILFDGYCNLCSGWVKFILKRDTRNQFQFCALQSETGKKLASRITTAKNLSTVVLLYNDKIYLKSTAALKIFGLLGKGWALLSVLLIVPAFIRDGMYDFIASHRYKWFGENKSCFVPSEKVRSKFIG